MYVNYSSLILLNKYAVMQSIVFRKIGNMAGRSLSFECFLFLFSDCLDALQRMNWFLFLAKYSSYFLLNKEINFYAQY